MKQKGNEKTCCGISGVRCFAIAYADFCGRVEITFPRFFMVYYARSRPLTFGIKAVAEPVRIISEPDRQVKLAVEIDKERPAKILFLK